MSEPTNEVVEMIERKVRDLKFELENVQAIKARCERELSENLAEERSLSSRIAEMESSILKLKSSQ